MSSRDLQEHIIVSSFKVDDNPNCASELCDLILIYIHIFT